MSDNIPTVNEEWRPVVGYGTRCSYFVSDLGRVKRVSRKGKVRFLATNPKGCYVQVHFRTNGKSSWPLVHRLVLHAFLPIDPARPDTNHKNGNKHDNRLSNLEWTNPSENTLHSFRELGRKVLRGVACPWSKLSEHDIRKIFELRKRGLLVREIGEAFGVSRLTISSVLNGSNWRHVTKASQPPGRRC